MVRRSLRILSGLPRLHGITTDRYIVHADCISGGDTFLNGMRLFSKARRYDIVLMNSSTRGVLGLCLMRWVWPFHRWKLVSLDIHLNEPIGWKQRVFSRLKRVLLRKVDLHILFFKDLSGYEKWFGISSTKAKFVPFKVNSWEIISHDGTENVEGEYVFCGGRSLRDLNTFKRAMAQISLPALLLYQQDPAFMEMHGTPVDLNGLPTNVRAECHDGSNDTWIEYIRRAKIVVIPTFANSIYAPGLSLYLLAMGLRRCVIVSEGPQTQGLLDKEAIIVPPEDPDALARAVLRAWKDNVFRKEIADAGRKYAERCAGESRMLVDIASVCGEFFFKQN